MSATQAPEEPKVPGVVVLLGNSNPHMQYPVYHPETGEQMGTRGAPAEHIKQSVTRVEMQPDFADREHVDLAASTDNDRQLTNIHRALPDEHKRYAIGIQHVEQIMDVHSGGVKPSWVQSADRGFAEAVAAYYNIPVGQPEMLLTTAGRDAVHSQHMTTGAQPAAFNYMALTASTVAPASTDTTLTGEITTAGGGLVRAQCTFAHTAGTNTSTLTKTFTANGTDALPVTIAQIGLFNGTGAVTMAYHTALSSSATLNVSGDSITVTETVTAG